MRVRELKSEHLRTNKPIRKDVHKLNSLPSIYEYGGEPVTTSRAVAEQFGKRHDHIVRDIESIITELNSAPNFGAAGVLNFEGASGLNFQPTPTDNGGELKIEQTAAINREFAAHNFFLTEYTDEQGKPRKQYILTRDGFTLLAMGFTGAKAMQFKVAYINAFNRMEELIKGKGAGLLENAQRAAVQLGAVEDIAGAGKNTAADEVASQTLRALRVALESGTVTLRKKYTDKGDSNCIGHYDHFTASVYSKELYKAYANSFAHPLPYTTWHSILKQSKSIKFAKWGSSGGHHRAKALIVLTDIGYSPEE